MPIRLFGRKSVGARGVFDVAVLKNGFALRLEGNEEESIHIPLSGIKAIAV